MDNAMRSSLKKSLLIAAAALLVISVAAFWLLRQHDLAVEERNHAPLTLEETLGAAFSQGYEESIFSYAWPFGETAAKPYLWKLTEKPNQNHSGAWIMLAGIGDESDVARIRNVLRTEFEGRLDTRDRYDLYAICEAVGILARRKVPGASELLDEMLTVEFWKAAPFSFYDLDDAHAKRHIPWHNRIAPFTILLQNYLFAGGDDFSGKCEALAAACDEPKSATELRSQRFQAALRKNAEEREERLKFGVSGDDRKLLNTLFNGDFENPGRRQFGAGDAG